MIILVYRVFLDVENLRIRKNCELSSKGEKREFKSQTSAEDIQPRPWLSFWSLNIKKIKLGRQAFQTLWLNNARARRKIPVLNFEVSAMCFERMNILVKQKMERHLHAHSEILMWSDVESQLLWEYHGADHTSIFILSGLSSIFFFWRVY